VSDQLRDLVMPVGEFEPPLDLHSRIVARERELAVAHRPSRRLPRVLVFAVAATGVALVIVMLALAAHSRSSAPQPTKPPPFPAPPACAIATGGSGVDCGPGSAAIRTAGHWQVINQGRCINHNRLYFGVHTTNGDALLSLMLDMPPGALATGGDVQVTNGQLALVSGAKESLSGQAAVEPGGKSGAFTVHGRDAQGRPDGNTYAGAWTCRAGHPPKQGTPQQQTPRSQLPHCTQKEVRRSANVFVFRDGYWLSCGPASAIVWAGGRWQVVSPGVCSDSDYADFHFGIDHHHAHRWLQFVTDFAITGPALANLIAHGGYAAVPDGEINVLGAHEALSGREIIQRGGGGGAFALGRSRTIYVGAWTCGLPK
jgi:hypothetical protein